MDKARSGFELANPDQVSRDLAKEALKYGRKSIMEMGFLR